MLKKLFKGKKLPEPEATPFSRKVLLALQNLQGDKRYHCGASVKEIVRYMAQHFQIDGDVLSQVKVTLEKNTFCGTVEELNKRYLLMGASAHVAMTPRCSKDRFKEVARVQTIYPSTWNSAKICRPPPCSPEKPPCDSSSSASSTSLQESCRDPIPCRRKPVCKRKRKKKRLCLEKKRSCKRRLRKKSRGRSICTGQFCSLCNSRNSTCKREYYHPKRRNKCKRRRHD